MSDYIQVATSVAEREDAQRMARALVEQRLAACVQVLGPMMSTYRWQGQVETAQEWLCLAKTRREAYQRLQQAILELHPYDVPEILATPVEAGNPAYLAWIDDALAGA